jgi:hypothetical protein
MGRSHARALVGWFVGAALSACSSTPTSESPVSADPTRDPSHVRADAAPYEVHEWGLLRAEAGDVLNAGVVAPPDYRMMDVDKPVLYFHAQSAVRLKSVRVRTPSGSILEHWPITGLGSDTNLVWTDVAIDPHAECRLSKLPNASQPPCSLLPAGTACETAGLAAVRTEDAACVTVGESSDRFLFYRARSKTFTPPLRFTHQSDGSVDVENESNAAIPGVMIRIWNDGQAARSMVALPPAPHAKVSVGRESSADKDVDAPSDRRGRALGPAVGPGPEALRMTLGELGMTTAESEAFLGAWAETLFSAYRSADDESDQRPLEPADSFVYFLPVSTIDAVATLELDPPPRVVKRAFAIWSPIRATGSGR